MKNSLIINQNIEMILNLSEKFENYLPSEDEDYTKVATLGVIEYDYLYIINSSKDTLKTFAKLFSSNEENFSVVDSSFENESILEKINIAFHIATYGFSKDIDFKKSTSTIKFEENTVNIKKSTIISNAINRCRNLVNEPSNYLTTTSFTTYLEKLATDYSLDIEIIYKKQLQEMGAGGILAVNKGSKEEARIVTLTYNGSEENEKPYVLVGKGLIFDTGGYSLKPSSSITNMKSDMGGAALVVSVMAAIAKLKLPINVTCIVPITDNLVNENAYRPDDVIKFMNNKTTEILSTDAEGRLILADSLCIAQTFEPQLIIDAATLTGAVIAAIGNNTTGVFGNAKAEIDKLIETTHKNDEYAWHLPINDTHREQVKSKIATLKNSASPAGASTAAAFLEHFVGDYPWIHLDIAGTSWSDSGDTITKKGATGSMVRPLIEYFINIKE